MIPGEIFPQPGSIELNVGRDTLTSTVANSGDRPIQIGSHFHFYEVNSALIFDRDSTIRNAFEYSRRDSSSF
jgi:urease subunit beta